MNDLSIDLVDQGHHRTMRFQGTRYHGTFHDIGQQRETVAILKQADLAPLDVTGYGTLDERLLEGHEIDDAEIELMNRALEENSVIVAQMTPFFGNEAQSGAEH